MLANKSSNPQSQIVDELYLSHVKMEQIYINTYIVKKFDHITVDEQIKILEQSFKKLGIKQYDLFMKYVSNQESYQELQKNLDGNQSIILIELHGMCNQLIYQIKYMQENRVIKLLEQQDWSLQPILANLLINVLEDDWIKQQLPELQKEIIRFSKSIVQSKGDSQVREVSTQKEVQLQQQQAIKKIKGDKSYKILIIGASGTGKTTLANKLISSFSSSASNKFNFNNDIDGGSMKLEFQQIQYKNINIGILDSPGFGNVETNLQNMMQDICNQAKRINMILYCFNSTILRYNRQDLLTISIIQGLYSESWENFFVCLNFLDLLGQNDLNKPSFQIIDSINKRLKSNIPYKNVIQNDETVEQRISDIIELQYSVTENMSGFEKKFIPNMQLIQQRCKEYSS